MVKNKTKTNPFLNTMPTETKSDMLYEQRKVRNFLYNIQLFTLLATGGFAIVGAWSGSLVEPSGK
jgi:hypothetical protein